MRLLHRLPALHRLPGGLRFALVAGALVLVAGACSSDPAPAPLMNERDATGGGSPPLPEAGDDAEASADDASPGDATVEAGTPDAGLSACTSAGEACASGAECCTASCTSGHCDFARFGAACGSWADCLGGACGGGVCGCALNNNDQGYYMNPSAPAPPPPSRTGCTLDSDCCSGHCEPQPYDVTLWAPQGTGLCCAQVGTTVGTSEECCTGTADYVPSPDGGANAVVCALDHGQSSGTHCATDDECVTGQCVPTTVGGVVIQKSCVYCFASGHSCQSDTQCCFGTCVGAACQPSTTCDSSCANRACGPNGCGVTCGVCPRGLLCTSAGQCVSQCTPSCAGLSCGPDGCGGSCGACAAGLACSGGRCVTGGGGTSMCPDWTSCLTVAQTQDAQGCNYANPTNHCAQAVQVEICWQNTDGTCDCGESDIASGQTQSSAGWWNCQSTGHLRFYGTDPAGWGVCPTLNRCD